MANGTPPLPTRNPQRAASAPEPAAAPVPEPGPGPGPQVDFSVGLFEFGMQDPLDFEQPLVLGQLPGTQPGIGFGELQPAPTKPFLQAQLPDFAPIATPGLFPAVDPQSVPRFDIVSGFPVVPRGARFIDNDGTLGPTAQGALRIAGLFGLTEQQKQLLNSSVGSGNLFATERGGLAIRSGLDVDAGTPLNESRFIMISGEAGSQLPVLPDGVEIVANDGTVVPSAQAISSGLNAIGFTGTLEDFLIARFGQRNVFRTTDGGLAVRSGPDSDARRPLEQSRFIRITGEPQSDPIGANGFFNFRTQPSERETGEVTAGLDDLDIGGSFGAGTQPLVRGQLPGAQPGIGFGELQGTGAQPATLGRLPGLPPAAAPAGILPAVGPRSIPSFDFRTGFPVVPEGARFIDNDGTLGPAAQGALRIAGLFGLTEQQKQLLNNSVGAGNLFATEGGGLAIRSGLDVDAGTPLNESRFFLISGEASSQLSVLPDGVQFVRNDGTVVPSAQAIASAMNALGFTGTLEDFLVARFGRRNVFRTKQGGLAVRAGLDSDPRRPLEQSKFILVTGEGPPDPDAARGLPTIRTVDQGRVVIDPFGGGDFVTRFKASFPKTFDGRLRAVQLAVGERNVAVTRENEILVRRGNTSVFVPLDEIEFGFLDLTADVTGAVGEASVRVGSLVGRLSGAFSGGGGTSLRQFLAEEFTDRQTGQTDTEQRRDIDVNAAIGLIPPVAAIATGVDAVMGLTRELGRTESEIGKLRDDLQSKRRR